jgi:hypothetical protein
MPGGPSIMVKILGDMTGLGNSFGTAQNKGQSAAAGIHSAFSTMLGTLNKTGVLGGLGDALSTADQALGQMGEHAKDTSSKMIGIGGAAAGVGLALSAMGSKDQAAHQQLQASVAASGHSYDQYGAKVDEAIKHQAKFGYSSAETQDALRKLTQATGDPAAALKMLSTATDLAAAKHEDLSTAATQLAKTYGGSTKLMKEFNISVTAAANPQKALTAATAAHSKAVAAQAAASRSLLELQTADAASKTHNALQAMKLQDAQNKVAAANLTALSTSDQLTKAQNANKNAAAAHSAAITALGNKLSGQASAQANTFSGHMKALRTEIENQTSALGQKYGPALTKAGAALSGLGSVIKVVQGVSALFRTAQVAETAATVEETGATWSLNAALLANPIVLIIAGIAALIAIIVVVIAHFVGWKAVVTDTWAAIDVAFHAILNVVSSVIGWIEANWPLLLGILTGPIGLAVEQIVTRWSAITSMFQTVINWVNVHAHEMFDPFLDAAKAVWDGIAKGWNDTVGSLSFTVPGWVPLVGGHGFSMPKIPTFEWGGVVPTTGLALVHAGETVVPAGASVGRGIHIENLNVSSQLDIDAAMSQLAWSLRRQSA